MFAKICSPEAVANLRDADLTALVDALIDLGYLSTARGPRIIQGREARAWMWQKEPEELRNRLCERHEQFETEEAEARDATGAARLKQIDAGIVQLEVMASKSDKEEDDDDPGRKVVAS